MRQHFLATLLAQIPALSPAGAIEIARATGVDAETPRFAFQHQRAFVSAGKDDRPIVEFRATDFGSIAKERGNVVFAKRKRLAHRERGVVYVHVQRQRRHADSIGYSRRLARHKRHGHQACSQNGKTMFHCAPLLSSHRSGIAACLGLARNKARRRALRNDGRSPRLHVAAGNATRDRTFTCRCVAPRRSSPWMTALLPAGMAASPPTFRRPHSARVRFALRFERRKQKNPAIARGAFRSASDFRRVERPVLGRSNEPG